MILANLLLRSHIILRSNLNQMGCVVLVVSMQFILDTALPPTLVCTGHKRVQARKSTKHATQLHAKANY